MKNTEDLQFSETESVLTQSCIYIYIYIHIYMYICVYIYIYVIYIYNLEKILSQLLMTSKERDSMKGLHDFHLQPTVDSFPLSSSPSTHEISALGYKTLLGLLVHARWPWSLCAHSSVCSGKKKRPLKETLYIWQEEGELV